MNAPFPCVIIGLDESREIATEYELGSDAPPTLRPLPGSHKRSLILQLPDGQILDIIVSEKVMTAVSNAWKAHDETQS